MTRVALLPSAYLPTLGGVQELTRNLALALKSAGDQVEVWTQQADGLGPGDELLDGLVVRRFPFPLPRSDVSALPGLVGGSLQSLWALRQAVRHFSPDVLHVQCFGPNGVYATALSLLTGVPLVISLQGETMMDDHDAFGVSTTLRTALRGGLRRAAAVTGCSQHTLDDAVTRFGLPPGRGEVVFNGVDLDLAPAPAAPAHPGRYVAALGRVVPNKGFDLLVRAFALVADRHPGVTLRIGGSGPAESDLRRLVGELGLHGRVDLLGRLSREEVAAVMAGADVFVMPSRLEPFGIVILEAWRAGAPVIATTVGGPPEFVQDGVTGLLADPADTELLADKLDRLLSDAALRDRLRAAGRDRVKQFGWPEIAARYHEIHLRASARSGAT